VQNTTVFANTMVYNTAVFVKAKQHLEVLKTVFSETMVFLEYLKKNFASKRTLSNV
jgi:hypothetical protein